MRKVLASVAAVAVLIVGALAVTSITAGGAEAQDDTAEVETTHPRLTSALDELVADGVITQEQADAVAEKLGETFTRRHRHPVRRGLSTAADAIGITAAELAEQLVDGASIADVAEANGVDSDDVVDAMVAAAESRLATAVENGRITQDAADERLEDLSERIEALVDGELDRSDFDRSGRRFGTGSGENGAGFGIGA